MAKAFLVSKLRVAQTLVMDQIRAARYGERRPRRIDTAVQSAVEQRLEKLCLDDRSRVQEVA